MSKSSSSNTTDNNTTNNEEKKEIKYEYTPGLIIKITNLIPTNTTVDQLKDYFNTYGMVKYVDYESGNSHAIIRVSELSTMNAIKTAIDSGLKLPLKSGGAEGSANSEGAGEVVEEGENIVGEIMTGDEELAYMKVSDNCNIYCDLVYNIEYISCTHSLLSYLLIYTYYSLYICIYLYRLSSTAVQRK